MAEVLVVVSKIKKMVKEQDLRTGNDFILGLSQKVESIVKEAINRVKADGKKKTLGLEDLG